MNLLLHACCGPCAIKCVESLKAESISPTLFYFNPNIHPFLEYESRRESLLKLADETATPAIIHGAYGLKDFLNALNGEFDHRCGICYQIRLEETAKYAKENDFDGFTSTLLISPYQNHKTIIKSGEAAASKFDIPFLYRDFRPLFREGQKAAREMGLYMQKYCGCVFSEEERYRQI